MKIQYSKNGEVKELDIYGEEGLKIMTELWTRVSFHNRIAYEPKWLGIPIIQEPSDIIMMQELIWNIKPDVIIETGVAHGGSAVLYASLLEMVGKSGEVIAIDIDIREHNKKTIKEHPLSKRIKLLEGSSIDPDIIQKLKDLIRDKKKVLVVLDSNHSYKHVTEELRLYSELVSIGSYLVVMDGIQEMLADNPTGKKEWITDNPNRALKEFMDDNTCWETDIYYNRLQITYSPKGFLKKIK